jgi:hypothetical protein
MSAKVDIAEFIDEYDLFEDHRHPHRRDQIITLGSAARGAKYDTGEQFEWQI